MQRVSFNKAVKTIFFNRQFKQIGCDLNSGLLGEKDDVTVMANYCTLPPPGSGAGRGGGAGGSVRESGGGLGKYGAAQEEGYFFNKGKEQLERLKSKIKKDAEKSPSVTRKLDK